MDAELRKVVERLNELHAKTLPGEIPVRERIPFYDEFKDVVYKNWRLIAQALEKREGGVER